MKPRQHAADAAAAETEAMRARAGDRIGRIIDRSKRELAGAGFARAAKRAATLQLGVIRTDDGGAVDCDILDLTGAGMRIGLRAEIALPDRFVVLVPARRQRFIVARRWKRAQFIGVEIIGRSAFGASGREKTGNAGNTFAADERGGTALEYALIAALIAALIVLNVSMTGEKTNAAIESAANALVGTAPATAAPPAPDSDPAAANGPAGASGRGASAPAAAPPAKNGGGKKGKSKKKNTSKPPK